MYGMSLRYCSDKAARSLSLEKAQDFQGHVASGRWVFHVIRCQLTPPPNLSNNSGRKEEASAVTFIEEAHGQLARLLNDASAILR